MQVAISISEGRLSSVTLMRRLRSNSRKNRIYKVFREVGRSARTVALLRYLADPQLRVRITAATNKVESYNGFAHWLAFGNNGVLADNDPAEQEKLIKFNTCWPTWSSSTTPWTSWTSSAAWSPKAGPSPPTSSPRCRPTFAATSPGSAPTPPTSSAATPGLQPRAEGGRLHRARAGCVSGVKAFI